MLLLSCAPEATEVKDITGFGKGVQRCHHLLLCLLLYVKLSEKDFSLVLACVKEIAFILDFEAEDITWQCHLPWEDAGLCGSGEVFSIHFPHSYISH